MKNAASARRDLALEAERVQQEADNRFPCPETDCRMRCLSQRGLELHLENCIAKGPHCQRHTVNQLQSIDLLAQLAPQHAAQPAAATASCVNAPHDKYQLVGGLCLRLPQPQPLPAGWASRPKQSVVRRSKEQLLYLMDEFLKNKAQGRHARLEDAEVARACSQLGPALSAAQVRSDFSNLQKKWDAGREDLEDKADELRQQVLAAAHLAANEMAEASAAATVNAAYGLLLYTEAAADQAREDLAGPSDMPGVLGDSLGEGDDEDDDVE